MTSTQRYATRCDMCGGTFVALPSDCLCYDCWSVVEWWNQIPVPPMSDEDEYMIINHYAGL